MDVCQLVLFACSVRWCSMLNRRRGSEFLLQYLQYLQYYGCTLTPHQRITNNANLPSSILYILEMQNRNRQLRFCVMNPSQWLCIVVAIYADQLRLSYINPNIQQFLVSQLSLFRWNCDSNHIDELCVFTVLLFPSTFCDLTHRCGPLLYIELLLQQSNNTTRSNPCSTTFRWELEKHCMQFTAVLLYHIDS